MTIKEVEEQLGLSRATIRFYEKENLLVPKRNGNTYREYSEEDIVVLKKIIILRKLGFSVAVIKDFLEENVPLQELLEKNIQELHAEIYSFNTQSQKMFQSIGFKKVDDEQYILTL